MVLSSGAIGAKHQPEMNRKKRKQTLTSGGKYKRQRTNVVNSEYLLSRISKSYS